MVVLEHGRRIWINRPHEERGAETNAFTADLIDLLGSQKTIVGAFGCPVGVWPNNAPPRSYIAMPLELRGAFVGILVIADQLPRIWSEFEANYMVRAARLVTNHFEARAALAERDRAQEELAAALVTLEVERNSLEARVVERTLALREAVREADEANAAKSMFLATITHELRTPLHTIISYSEMVKEDVESGTPVPTQTARDLDTIVTSSHHLLSLIGGVLDFSKIEAGEMVLSAKPFELAPLLEECVASVRQSAARNGNVVRFDADSAVRELNTDRLRLKQCLLNLLANAAKFTSNGEISVIAACIDDGAERWLRISVIDTGIGMTPEALKRLFEPFYQVDASYTRAAEGTGLGLALTQRIIRLLGGTLTVESAPGTGSAFTVHLPLEAALVAQTPADLKAVAV
jgi:signal transduction histidine kinase